MSRALLTLLLLTLAASALAQDVPIEVRVRVQDGERGVLPIADATVQLHVITPPHTLEASHSAVTDAEGVARFTVPARAGSEAYAELDNGRRFFSEAVPLDDPVPRTMVLDAYPVVHDTSVLFAASVQSIVELWESYLVVSQVWTFGVDEPVVFQSTTERMGSIVRVPVPEDAVGVTVVHPAEEARVMDGYVAVAVDVAPAGVDEDDGPDLMMRFSVPSENRRRVRFDQSFSMDVERLSVIVPQQSQHARHRQLDVRLDVPLCEESDSPDFVCFHTIGDRAEGALIREDIPVQVGRGRARAGQVLELSTVGWPHASRAPEAVATGLGVGVGIFGLLLWRRERARRGRTEEDVLTEALATQREQLVDAAAELEARLAAGELLERDAEVARSRIREQLAAVLRRQRELSKAGSEEAS